MRIVKPEHVSKPLHRSFAQKTGDSFFYLMPSTMVTGMASVFIIGGALASSLYFLLLLLPFFLVSGWLIKFTIDTKCIEYSWEETLYAKAYREYVKITDPDLRSLAFTLLENVWKHESISESHTDRMYGTSCDECRERISLIRQLKDRQLAMGNSRSDIESVREILKAHKELTA